MTHLDDCEYEIARALESLQLTSGMFKETKEYDQLHRTLETAVEEIAVLLAEASGIEYEWERSNPEIQKLNQEEIEFSDPIFSKL